MSKIRKDNDAKQEKLRQSITYILYIRFNRRLNTRTAPSLYYIIRIREKRLTNVAYIFTEHLNTN